MGHKEFGNLINQKNTVSYALSPFEQRAFAGLPVGLANWWRRTRVNLMFMAPGMIILGLTINYCKKTNAAMKRKNPKDYENEH